MNKTWKYLVDWTSEVGKLHGGYTVIDKREGKVWDWGQALCRELYGFDWMDEPGFNEISDLPPDEPAPDYVIKRADEMLAELPDWIKEVR